MAACRLRIASLRAATRIRQAHTDGFKMDGKKGWAYVWFGVLGLRWGGWLWGLRFFVVGIRNL